VIIRVTLSLSCLATVHIPRSPDCWISLVPVGRASMKYLYAQSGKRSVKLRPRFRHATNFTDNTCGYLYLLCCRHFSSALRLACMQKRQVLRVQFHSLTVSDSPTEEVGCGAQYTSSLLFAKSPKASGTASWLQLPHLPFVGSFTA
jgi:hypothetical protein